jgi:hypothetical protein
VQMERLAAKFTAMQQDEALKVRPVGQSTVGDALAWHDGWYEGYAQALRDAGAEQRPDGAQGWRWRNTHATPATSSHATTTTRR